MLLQPLLSDQKCADGWTCKACVDVEGPPTSMERVTLLPLPGMIQQLTDLQQHINIRQASLSDTVRASGLLAEGAAPVEPPLHHLLVPRPGHHPARPEAMC
jgi:hypothetical protein